MLGRWVRTARIGVVAGCGVAPPSHDARTGAPEPSEDLAASGESDRPDADTGLAVEPEQPEGRTCSPVEGTHPELAAPEPDLSGVAFEVHTPVDGWGLMVSGFDLVTNLVPFRPVVGAPPVLVAVRYADRAGNPHPTFRWDRVARRFEHVSHLAAHLGLDLGPEEVPLGFADLDGDGVDEVFVPDAVIGRDRGGWVRHPHQGLTQPGCASKLRFVDTPTFFDQDGDGDQDMLAGSQPAATWGCRNVLAPNLFVLEQVGRHQFAVRAGSFVDDVNDFGNPATTRGYAWAEGLMHLRGAPGERAAVVLVGGTYLAGLGVGHEESRALGYEHRGVFVEDAARRFVAVDALVPDAFIRRQISAERIAALLGVRVTDPNDFEALIGAIARALGLDEAAFAAMTLAELEDAVNAALTVDGEASACFADALLPDPRVELTSDTPMGAGVGDLDGDGRMEFVVTNTFADLQSVFSLAPGDPVRLRDHTGEALMRFDHDHPEDPSSVYGDPGTVAQPRNDQYGWGVEMVDVNGDRRLDVPVAVGWDFGWFACRGTPDPVCPVLTQLEIHVNTGEVLRPGDTIPAFQQSSHRLFPDAPGISGHGLCATDLDANGAIDFVVGTGNDTDGTPVPGVPPGRDGAPRGPLVFLNASVAPVRSFTVTPRTVLGDSWFRVTFSDGHRIVHPVGDSNAPRLLCHPVWQVAWRDGDPQPTLLEVLDSSGSRRYSAADLAPGRLITIPL